MLAAVEHGDVKELAELIRQDPGFRVNKQDIIGLTLLHYACERDSRSAVIPLLLAYPDLDVNVKSTDEETPFYYACWNGGTSCVREMLKDSRVKVNEPTNSGHTPLWWAAGYGHLDVIRWWIASEREMGFRKPGDKRTDAIGGAERETQDQGGDRAGEIQGESTRDQAFAETGNRLVQRGCG